MKKQLATLAWVVIAVAGLFVVARLGTALPVAAASAGPDVLVTATNTSQPPTFIPTAAPSTATPAPSQGTIANPSFETGDLTGWLTSQTNDSFMAPQVVGGQFKTAAKLPFYTAPDGQYAAWIPWWGCGPGNIRLMQDVVLPEGRPVLMFDYRAAWDLQPKYASDPQISIPSLKFEDRPFYVVIEEVGGGKELARHLILTAPGGEMEDIPFTAAYTPYEEDTGLLLATVDLSEFAGQAVRIALEWQVQDCMLEGIALMQVDNFRLVTSSGKPRTDVSVIVYGGWDGMVARAWVGGTAQPERITAVNSYGDAQATWTFYPDGTWPISVNVDLPAGLDPDQWEMRLVRISSPTADWSMEEPGSASFQAIAGEQYNVYYQLVHK